MSIFNESRVTNYLQKPYTSIIPLGDSITSQGGGNQSGTLISYSNRGYFGVALHKLNWPLQVLYNAGVSGQGTTAILARLQTDVIDRSPDICSILAGSNDLFGTPDAAATIANLQSMYTQIIDAGIIPIACTIPAANYDAANEAAWYTINTWIKTYCFDNNIIVADFASVTTDPTATTLPWHYTDDFNADELHPDKGGAKRMGDEFARVLSPLIISTGNTYPSVNNDPTNLVTNTLLQGTGGSDFSPGSANTSGPIPDGFTFYSGQSSVLASSTFTIEALEGKNQLNCAIANTGTTTVDGSLQMIVSASAGQVVTPYAEFGVTNGVDVQTFEVRIAARDSGGTVLLESRGLSRSESKAIATFTQVGALQTPDMTLPAGTADVRFTFLWSMVSGNVTFSRPSLTIRS